MAHVSTVCCLLVTVKCNVIIVVLHDLEIEGHYVLSKRRKLIKQRHSASLNKTELCIDTVLEEPHIANTR